MKSIWIGIGFSHHSVPSLSNTATRSSTGTSSQTRATNSTIASRAGASRQLDNPTAALVVVMRARYVRARGGSSPRRGDCEQALGHQIDAERAEQRDEQALLVAPRPVGQAVEVGGGGGGRAEHERQRTQRDREPEHVVDRDL